MTISRRNVNKQCHARALEQARDTPEHMPCRKTGSSHAVLCVISFRVHLPL